MKKHIRKMIAPVVVTLLMILYLCAVAVVWVYIPAPTFLKIIGTVVVLALMGVSLFVLIERIKEVQKGEEDDLSKY